MPFYEYECGACGKTHEAMQKVSDPPLRKCPACGKSRLRKLMSAPIFRLKGSGWYETDFKSDQDKKRNLAVDKDDSAKPEAAKPEAAKSEAKAGAPKADTAKTDAGKAGPAKKESKAEAPKAAENKRASRSASKSRRPAARQARR
jgi:putative FmdB family regulatory protein